MKILGQNPNNNDSYEAEAGEVDEDFIEKMSMFDMAEEAIQKMINKLNISADAKHLLYKISGSTIRVGKFIMKVGRKIIDFVCKIYDEFPQATFGAILGAIAGVLVASIPIIGIVLGAIVTPLAVAFGLVTGASHDFKNKNLDRKIAEANAQFSPLNA